MYRRFRWLTVLFGLLLWAAGARAASDVSGPVEIRETVHAPLRVAIAPVAPFVLPQTAVPEGFSIDLWNELARRMHVDFTWVRLPASTDLLPAVQHGDADVAIAAITITAQRERSVDFSLPYFDSGLQIIVRAQNDSAWMDTLCRFPGGPSFSSCAWPSRSSSFLPISSG